MGGWSLPVVVRSSRRQQPQDERVVGLRCCVLVRRQADRPGEPAMAGEGAAARTCPPILLSLPTFSPLPPLRSFSYPTVHHHCHHCRPPRFTSLHKSPVLQPLPSPAVHQCHHHCLPPYHHHDSNHSRVPAACSSSLPPFPPCLA